MNSELLALADEKVCSTCKISKPLSEFRIWKAGKSYRPCARCDDCRRENYRSESYRKTQNERYAIDRAAGKRKKYDDAHARNRELNHKEKTTAKRQVRTAIANGTLIKPTTCEACGVAPAPLRDGRSGLQAHHPNYAEPLNVRWLCHHYHVLEHKMEARNDN